MLWDIRYSNKTLKDKFNLVDDYSSNKYNINVIINKIYIISETVEKIVK